MGRKKHVEEAGAGEGWLVSYCDMISLLVTFFLMMMTFSTSSKGDIKTTGVGLLKGRGGIFPNLSGSEPPQAIDPTVLEKMSKDLDSLRQSGGSKNQLGLNPMLDGLAIEFDSECSFAPGSSEPNEKLRGNLEELGKKLGRYDQLIVVEGHADDAELDGSDAERLSGQRALAAAKILLSVGSAIARDQIQVAAQGSKRPRATDGSALGRRMNRRVEVRVLAVTRNKALASTGGASLKH
jgi:chemotaxis protein MotB